MSRRNKKEKKKKRLDDEEEKHKSGLKHESLVQISLITTI